MGSTLRGKQLQKYNALLMKYYKHLLLNAKEAQKYYNFISVNRINIDIDKIVHKKYILVTNRLQKYKLCPKR